MKRRALLAIGLLGVVIVWLATALVAGGSNASTPLDAASALRAVPPAQVWVAPFGAQDIAAAWNSGAVLLDRFPEGVIVGDAASAAALARAGFQVDGPLAIGRGETVLFLRATAAGARAADLDAAALDRLGARALWRDARNVFVATRQILPDAAALSPFTRQALRRVPLVQPPATPPAGAPSKTLATTFAPVIQQMVAQVDTASYMAWIKNLAGANFVSVGGHSTKFKTRSTPTAQCDSAEQYVYERFQAMGFTDVQYDPYTFSSTSARNVIATLAGTTNPNRIVIIGGHLDSTSPQSATLAPGANDNGSGTASVLAVANILKNYQFKNTIRFIAFTGEEQGLYGSQHYAQAAAARGDSILGAVITDMVAWYGSNYGIDIEGETPWDWLMQIMKDACTTYTPLNTSLQYTSSGSDHVPFQDQGYAAFLAIESEYASYSYYHQTTDTWEKQKAAFGADVTKACLATVAHVAVPRAVEIVHTPLTDTENTTGPYAVVATITAPAPLDASSLYVHWGVGALTDSLLLSATANPNEYAAAIPGPLANVDVRYYIVAKDTGGGRATHPAGAPASYHQFHVGADTTPPVITHTALPNWPLVNWPPAVNATVTDNLGVNTSSVAVTWTLNGAAKSPFGLTRVGTTSSYTGSFPAGGVAAGDSVAYHITAQDVALVPNTGRSPLAGENRFAVIDILGRILVVDDDEVAKTADVKLVPGENEKAPWQPLVEKTQPAARSIQSASAMATALNANGYLATVQTMASTNPATWSGYDLIISASGANSGPLANATYRTALESWVAAGHKLLVEGGEVVYDAASYPGYPTFAANVLHTTDWDADNAGALTVVSAQASHPIVTTPYALPSTMSIAYASYGNQDAYKPTSPAYIVYGTASYPADGGILVYDNTPAPQSAQVVLFGFDYKVASDATTRAHLLLNTVAYLLASEPVADAGISGVATLANQLDHSGITLTLTPGGTTTTTNSSGNYAFSAIYPGTYTVTASKAGYKSESHTGVVVAAHTTTSGQDLKLYPQQEATYCLTPNLAIPDNNATGVSSNATVSQTWAVQGVEVQVNITHTYIGDLIVELRHGSKTVRLHNKTGSSSDNIVGTYPTTLAVDGPGALTDFVGDAANGTWTLFVSDTASSDTGTLVSWCLKLKGPADTTVDTDPDARVPVVAALSAGTNPMRGAGTTIRFGLPAPQHAALVVFNVAGQRVRTLVDAVTPAGYHDVHWDGRDSRGSRVAAGVYFYQLVTGETTLVRKLVVVR